VAGVLLATLNGDWCVMADRAITWQSVIGVLYQARIGSVVPFGLYSLLLTEWEPRRVATYAYISPLIAVILGWALLDEDVSSQLVLAIGFILAGVAAAHRGMSPVAPVAAFACEQRRRL
jgi:drug/metabolite transporter (DMT)-like permease